MLLYCSRYFMVVLVQSLALVVATDKSRNKKTKDEGGHVGY